MLACSETLPKAPTCGRYREDINPARHKTSLVRGALPGGAVAIVVPFGFWRLASERPKIPVSFHTSTPALTCKSAFPLGGGVILGDLRRGLLTRGVRGLSLVRFSCKSSNSRLFVWSLHHTPSGNNCPRAPHGAGGTSNRLPVVSRCSEPQVLTPDSEDAGTSFFSRLHSDITLSPCSWKVMMINATKMFTKKKGKTTKYTT